MTEIMRKASQCVRASSSPETLPLAFPAARSNLLIKFRADPRHSRKKGLLPPRLSGGHAGDVYFEQRMPRITRARLVHLRNFLAFLVRCLLPKLTF